MNWRGLVYRGWRRLMGDRQFEILKTLRESERWSPDRLREAQEARVRALLLHAFENVPYYREPLLERGVVIEGQPPRVDFSRFGALPLLTRATIRERALDLQDRRPARRGNGRFPVFSGGTTGDPIWVIQDRVTHQYLMAVKLWFDEWTGYTLGQPKVLLKNEGERPTNRPRAIVRRIGSYLRNEIPLRTGILSEGRIDAYIDRINAIRPVQILALPSAAHEVARRAEMLGRVIVPPRAVMVSAEPLLPEMRPPIEGGFRAPVFDRYGSQEVADVACECAYHRGLHISALTHYVEVVRSDGRPCDPGEIGEIAITLLTNYSMPLIRYRIGDFGALAPDPCPCGRSLPSLSEVAGRVLDSFIRADGILVHGIYLRRFYRVIPWIVRFQVVQMALNHVHVKLVDQERPASPMTARRGDLATIAAHIRSAMGENCRVTFEFLDEIPPAPSGKYRATLSLVPR